MTRLFDPALFAIPLGSRDPAKAVPGSARLLRALSLLLLAACSTGAENDPRLSLPELSAADYRWVGTRIYRSETRGQARYLTYWGAGEDFPSLGIGHFIWFPAGVDAPFDETFVQLADYLLAQDTPCSTPPAWLQELQPFDAPWSDKESFDAAQSSPHMLELRQWLAATADQQVRFIAASLVQRWNELDLAIRQEHSAALASLLSTSTGLFAVIDYTHFKGLGTNPRERYSNQGWGLLQVLQRMSELQSASDSPRPAIEAFSAAAADRLTNRVRLAPAERDEQRWLPGWLRRVGSYTDNDTGSASGFRVAPYLQGPAADAMSLAWFSDTPQPGVVELSAPSAVYTSVPTPACDLAYRALELDHLDDGRLPTAPFRHVVHLTDLEPGREYGYRVFQDGEVADGSFTTLKEDADSLRFVVYADSETEPESTGKYAPWGSQDDRASQRSYPIDQTRGYAENLKSLRAFNPHFITIAGDLVESGGEQRDWDEFWRHNRQVGGTVPILPAPGNHEYFAGPGELGGYRAHAAADAIARYRTYFAAAAGQPESGEPYFSVRQGPATLIVVDSNDGVPRDTDHDSNWYLDDENSGGPAPPFNPGSAQYQWLETALAKAQQETPFTFVVFHAAPYTSGVHGQPPGLDEGEDYLPGSPLQVLTPLLQRYGVDAVFNGHDERYEHSIVAGERVGLDGGSTPHQVHFYTVGIGGDGLRGAFPGVDNPHRVFSADWNAPEVYEGTVLTDGGAHYGHLRVSIERSGDEWRAKLEPVYLFPVTGADGEVTRLESRIYDDVAVISKPVSAAGVSQ